MSPRSPLHRAATSPRSAVIRPPFPPFLTQPMPRPPSFLHQQGPGHLFSTFFSATNLFLSQLLTPLLRTRVFSLAGFAVFTTLTLTVRHAASTHCRPADECLTICAYQVTGVGVQGPHGLLVDKQRQVLAGKSTVNFLRLLHTAVYRSFV